ncbi:hypothetical protein C1X05_04205 [Laceyella sacchari]|nr:hypothetical protein [Laceyella tengchongensis]AUS08105.1 hypothetical protein C1X05_04205 [Laceyella sacchari]MRG29693.1 hypothetical protein [Laceyella tengchongensis]
MSLQLVENKQMNGSSNGIDTSKMYKLVPGNNGQRPLTFERMSGWEQAVLLNYASDPLGGTPIRLHRFDDTRYRIQALMLDKEESVTWVRGLKRWLVLDRERESTVWHFEQKGDNLYVISGCLGYWNWLQPPHSHRKWVHLSTEPLTWHLVPIS